MSFLFTTTAGAIDFAVLAVACLVVAWAGRPGARLTAAVLALVYLADRTLLAAMPYDLQMIFGAGVELLALLVSLLAVGGRLGRSVAALFFVKMLAYAACLYDFIDFGGMAAAATIGAYLQLMLLLGLGVPWHGLFKHFRGHGDHRPVADRVAGTVARGSEAK